MNGDSCAAPGAAERVAEAIAALAARGQTPILRGVSVATAGDRARIRAAAQALLDAAPAGRTVDPRRALLLAPAAKAIDAQALAELRSGATRAAIRRALPDGVYPVLVVDVDALRTSQAAIGLAATTAGGAPTPASCEGEASSADLEACAVLTGGATFLLEGKGTPVDLAARLTSSDRLSAATTRAVARARRAERAIEAAR